MNEYLRLLREFPAYAERGWKISPQGICYFGDPGSDENGLRSQANVVFIYSLLCTSSQLSQSETDQGRNFQRACDGLFYMTSGHLTGSGSCANGRQWGNAWQSAWWATRMAFGAMLIWDRLSEPLQAAIQRVVIYEANRHLSRIVPTGLWADTKAEENAWDAEILALAIAMFPEHEHVSQWREKLIEFSINIFSTPQDRISPVMIDGRRVCDQVYTTNLHSDFTLENHGAAHFCYFASPLHSVVWARFALQHSGTRSFDAQLHHFSDVWSVIKPTFLGDRFAYLSGKDWARYTYGLYFILPVLVMIQHEFGDSDARNMELARLRCLAEEHQENADGSFFGKRCTHGRMFGQHAKYETDCYANIGLAYLIHCRHGGPVAPTPEPTFSDRLALTHVSTECGVAYSRSSKVFASFSNRTLSTDYPTATFVPIGHDDMAEWASENLLGMVRGMVQFPAIVINSMRALDDGFIVEQQRGYRPRGRSTVYDHDFKFVANTKLAFSLVKSCVTVKRRFFVRFCEALHFLVPNDHFNKYMRRYYSDKEVREIHFSPPVWKVEKTSRAYSNFKRLYALFGKNERMSVIGSKWINIDDRLGLIQLSQSQMPFVIHQASKRNVGSDSLYADRISIGYPIRMKYAFPGKELFNYRCLLVASTAAFTRRLADKLAPISECQDDEIILRHVHYCINEIEDDCH